MISLQVIKGSPSDAQKYLQHGAEVERYYAGDDQRPEIERGVYFGGQSLGLDGQIVGDELHHILDGKNAEGQNLYERGRQGRRVGFDLTFSPDKSVSLLWARLDESERRRLEESFQKAVKDTLRYTHEHILNEAVRRGPGGSVKESPSELTFALFQHGSSRALDPQLHMHCVLMNFALRHDGTYGAIDPQDIFKQQVEIRRVFNMALAEHLQKDLGLEISTHREGIRIDGISSELIDRYSQRRNEIQEKSDALGLTTQQAGKLIALQTRGHKDLSIADRDLIPRWQTEFDGQGFERERAYDLLGKVQSQEFSLDHSVERLNAVFSEIGTRHKSLTETELRALCAEKFTGLGRLADLEEIISTVKNDPRLICSENGRGEKTYTTAASLEQEHKTFALGRELSERSGHAVSQQSLEVVLERYTRDSGMSEEQRRATEHILKDTDLSLLVGAAGTGKSFSLRAAREVLEESGYCVRGLAPTGKAADNLAQSADLSAKTVDKFLHDFERGKDGLSAQHVVIVDEAGMIGNEKMQKLLSIAYESEAKIILVGDHKQLSALDKGRPFERFISEVGAAEITEIRRQKIEWQKQAAQEAREGNIKSSLVKYQDQGLVSHGSSWGELREKLVSDWMRDHKNYPGERQLVLASTNEKVLELNKAIRERLQDDGLLATKGGAKIGVVRSDGSLESRVFCPGERLYFTRNDDTVGVRNGSLGTLEEINRLGRGVFGLAVRLDSGETVTFRSDTYKNIEYGYAATVHKSQGDTVERTYLVPEKYLDKEAYYVGLSRHTQECRLYCATELVHGYRREFESQLETERKIKLHLDKVTQNIEKATLKDPSIEKAQESEKAPQRSFVSDAHLEAAHRLSSADRLQTTDALYQLASLPHGVEHRFATYENKLTDYQREALRLLKSHDYSERRLEHLKNLVTQKERGVEPVLTDTERTRHYGMVSEAVSAREVARRFDSEIARNYLSPEQKFGLEKVAQAHSHEQQIQALKSLALEKPSVGLEFGKAHDPFHLNREAVSLLKDYERKTVTAWAKSQLEQGFPDGKSASVKHTDNFVSFVQSLEKHGLSEIKQERGAELKLEFTSETHRAAARELLTEFYSGNETRKIEALREIIATPRGLGPEFQQAASGLTVWQKQAVELFESRTLPSQKQVEKLAGVIFSAPRGLENPGPENTLPKGFERLAQMAAEQDWKKTLKMERSHEQERDCGMSL